MNNIALGNPDTDTLRSEMECGVDEQFIKGYHGPKKNVQSLMHYLQKLNDGTVLDDVVVHRSNCESPKMGRVDPIITYLLVI